MESLLWNHCCGIIAVESSLWNHCCGIIAVESLLWNHCYGIIAMESLLWNHCCGIIAVESWLWNPGCGSSLGTLWGLSGGWGDLGVVMGRSGLGRSMLLQIHGVIMHLSSRPPVLRESGEHRCLNSLFFTANSREPRTVAEARPPSTGALGESARTPTV